MIDASMFLIVTGGLVMAERHAAIHAARALGAELLLLHVEVKLLPVLDALRWRAVDGQFAQILDETGWLSHDA